MGRVPMYKIKDLIKNAYVLPIYAIIVFGAVGTGLFSYHATQNPEISWKRPYNEPFEAYRNKPYKLWMSDEYRAVYVCHAPEPPCYLSKAEQEQEEMGEAEPPKEEPKPHGGGVIDCENTNDD